MIVALLEAIALVVAIGSISLLCGLLRTAKAASQATEEQQLAAFTADDDEQSPTQGQSQTVNVLRNAS